MQLVWQNIGRQALTWQQCYCLLEQIVLAGRFSRPKIVSRLKDDYRQLEELNRTISKTAGDLAEMILARDAILNRNAFTLERTTHIVELMEMAEDNDGLYRSYLHETLDGMTCRYDGKYWPGLPGILQVIAREHPEIECLSESDQTIINGRGKVLPDYLRELFSSIENVRQGPWGLPKGFTLTDSSLATLATVTLDHTEVISADAVKVRRSEFSKRGERGAWPFKSLKAADSRPLT
ncbi:hypothetical protein [Klebsiella pneumoniae]|uniref:hypothetical protein n=1 Tax=Klebsiella pneumoniae TaxID=573 RepID=UPI002FE534EF